MSFKVRYVGRSEAEDTFDINAHVLVISLLPFGMEIRQNIEVSILHKPQLHCFQFITRAKGDLYKASTPC